MKRQQSRSISRPLTGVKINEKRALSGQGLKLYLVDGNSLFYRAYYAIPSLSNSKGEPTNAVLGFVTMLRKLLSEGKPEAFAICFDCREPTFRHEKYEDYKAHRKPMPDDLVDQIAPMKEFCRIYQLAAFEKPGFEADDLLGTLARRADEQGYEVFIITGDKDAMQLVNDRVKIINPHKENKVFDSRDVKAKFSGLGPDKVVEVMALMGDASDNIPGVRGIGEKTAVKLIQEFGSVKNLLQYVGRIKSKSQQAMIREHAEDAKLSHELAQIDTDVPVDVDWEKLRVREPDLEKLEDFYKRCEFRSLLKELTPAAKAEDEGRDYRLVSDLKTLKHFAGELKKAELFSFDTETTASDPMLAHLVGMSFSWAEKQAYYIPVSSAHHTGQGLDLEQVLEVLRPILEDTTRKKIGQNIKYDWIIMKRLGVDVRGIVFDTMIASYLLNPLKLNHNLDDISLEYLNLRKITTESLLGKGKEQKTMDQVPVEEIKAYACEDADCVLRLEKLLATKLKREGLEALFDDVEMPLSQVLAKMEMNGVSLDLDFLSRLSGEAEIELKRLTDEIYRLAGESFNINSTRQLGGIFFDKLKLPVVKRTKTGYSTDVNVLEKLAKDHELPRQVLEYRERTKLKSTYLDALPVMVNPQTGLIHTSYHQTTTATGRLSSSDPNLQNIPIKTEAGRRIRKAFVPRQDGKQRQILSADYSQIELRILAHLTGDGNLTKAFKEDLDVHSYTAMQLYGVKEKEVTFEMRNAAKTINFSIIYGKTAFGLSQDLGVSVGEADQFITNYFKRYHVVKDYLEAQKEKARKQGYLTTLLGRRSYFPDILSKNVQVRQFAERAAINAPIQGSAADLIKLAMIAVQNRLEKEKLESLMTMQVHDELVFDMVAAEKKALENLVREEMEGAYSLSVPLRADVFVGNSWYKT